MKTYKTYIYIFLASILFSCEKNASDLKKINLGQKLSVCVSKFKLNANDLHSIQEPPLISHGFSFNFKNGDIGYFIINRMPIEPKNLVDDTIYEQFKDESIIGIAWKSKDGLKEHIGVCPPRWKE